MEQEVRQEGRKGRLEEFQDSYNILRRIDKEKLMEGRGKYNLPYLLICFILMGLIFVLVVFEIIKLFA